MKRLSSVISFVVLSCVALHAQDKGYLTGSFETNSNIYVNDEFLPDNPGDDFLVNDDAFGSNNYLKLDYYNGRFTAGMQLEAYLPSLVGYPKGPDGLDKVALSNLYAEWKDEDFRITAGTFYDQFGSGLLFRTWEDRVLGLNNALMGARFAYNWEDKVAFKALWGLPRLGMTLSDTQVRGADLSISLSNIIGLDNVILSLEGSVLSKYYGNLSDMQVEAGGKKNTLGYSGRLNFDLSGFFVKAEYVDAGQIWLDSSTLRNGNAQLVELGYNGRGLGVTLTGRRLEHMGQCISYESGSTANLISYVPAMCTQYTYMLTALHPYSALVGDGTTLGTGEVGGQLDAFYNFRRGTAIGGKRGMKVHANFSTYYTLAGGFKAGNLLFRDFSFDVEKQWTKQFKMVFLYSLQKYNNDHGDSESFYNSNIFVADLLYKFTPDFSTRLELQYLLTKDDQKDWLAALLEVSFAPHWSIWASDMYNHGGTKLHYYNAGVSFSKGRTRLALGYGRFREGMICSGGVCRKTPAYTGANFTVTTSF